VNDWPSFPQDNQNQTFTIRKRLRTPQNRTKLRVFMDRVRFDESMPAELLSFLRSFFLTCNPRNVSEGKALYMVGPFLTGAPATSLTRYFLIRQATSGAGPSHSFLRRCTGPW